MKKILISLIIISGFFFYDCNKKCEKTEAPEINFDFRISGYVSVKNEKGLIITNQFTGKDFMAHYYKYHCDGFNRGPFEEPFSIDNNGEIWLKAGGTWSFKMDNTDDYLRIVFYYEGKELGKYKCGYDAMSYYDGSVAQLRFNVSFTWDRYGITDSSVELF